MVLLSTIPKVNREEVLNNSYKYLLGVSEDGLVIVERVNGEYELVEAILLGIDKEGIVLSAIDENHFLDAITIIKNAILSGKNPFEILRINNKAE